MLFGFLQALKSLRYKPLISLFTLLSLAGSYLVLFVGGCYAEDMAVSLYSYKMKDADQSIVAYYYVNDEQLTSDEIDVQLDQMTRTRNRCIIPWIREQQVNDKDLNYKIVPPSFNQFFNYKLLEGRMFTEEEWKEKRPVCIIEKSRKDLLGVQLGDSIEIQGKQFAVIGIIESMLFGKDVFIPNSWEKDFADLIIRYDVYLQLYEKADKDTIIWETIPIKNYTVMTGQELFSNSIGQMARLIAIIGGICVLLFLYVLFATYNLLSGRFYLRVRNFSIRLMVGANYRQLTMQVYFEILILSILAMLLVFASEPLVYSLVHETINHFFGWGTLIFMVFCAAIIPYPLSCKIMKKEYRKNSISALTGGAAR